MDRSSIKPDPSLCNRRARPSMRILKLTQIII
jgi:hypothetical protein